VTVRGDGPSAQPDLTGLAPLQAPLPRNRSQEGCRDPSRSCQRTTPSHQLASHAAGEHISDSARRARQARAARRSRDDQPGQTEEAPFNLPSSTSLGEDGPEAQVKPREDWKRAESLPNWAREEQERRPAGTTPEGSRRKGQSSSRGNSKTRLGPVGLGSVGLGHRRPPASRRLTPWGPGGAPDVVGRLRR